MPVKVFCRLYFRNETVFCYLNRDSSIVCNGCDNHCGAVQCKECCDEVEAATTLEELLYTGPMFSG